MEEEEWKSSRDRDRDGEFEDSDETLLPDHAFVDQEGSDDEGDRTRGSRGGMKSTLWTVLAATATLAGRRILRNGFPYPFYFLLLLQLSAYVTVAVVVLIVKLGRFNPTQRRGERYTILEALLIGFRVLTSSVIAAVGMLFGAQALLKFENLAILAMLPILTYTFDSVFFRLANILHLFPRDQSLSLGGLYRVILVPIFVVLILNEDYRLDKWALQKALASFALLSISKVFSRIGPRINRGPQSWETALQLYLLAGIPPLLLAGIATSKYENVVAASHIAESWGIAYRIVIFVPGVVLHILYNSTMLSSYPFMSHEHVGGALEEGGPEATDALTSTLQAGFWVLIIGALGKERNFLNWIQAIALALIYIICVGPNHIGYYPPRALNFILRILRRRSLPIRPEPWQFSFFLVSTTAIFGILISTQIMFWTDTIAYKHDLSTWFGPSNIILDTIYRPPELRSFDIVIAHSAGDPVDSIADLISSFARLPHFLGITHVKVYTQDPEFPLTDEIATKLKGEFQGDVVIQTIHNIGGPTAAYLHHILYSYDALPVHTLFLSTNSATHDKTPAIVNRLYNYYIPPDFPIPDAMAKTGFLNLGEVSTCYCGNCFDSSGWEDSFNLVPSMWEAARPGSPRCKSVLLTHGNNFFASAARIRGLKKDVWQMLYDALTNTDLGNAWAHASEKMPKKLEGEGGRGKWGWGRIYGLPDSLERPYLGMTIERLWGVLLQCSNGEIAWKCPTMDIGMRRGGDKHDCGCID